MKKQIKILFFILLGSFFFGKASLSQAATITTLTVRDKAGIATEYYPLTFGQVFKRGDVLQTVSLEIEGQPIATQVDIKTHYTDGSVRFAIISAIVPIKANQDSVFDIVPASSSAAGGEMDKAQILATDVGASIELNNISGSGYAGSLTADLRSAISAQSDLNYWLKGGIVTEILVDQKLNSSLNATWEVRFYPGTPYVQISHSLENVEANYRGNISYTLDITQGNNSPALVYAPKTVTQLENSRWRKVFWLSQIPPEVEIHWDSDYLIATGVIMPYDTSISISESAIASLTSSWKSNDTDIYGKTYSGGSWLSGLAMMNFGSTGGRPEIGMLPKWSSMYLLSWDNRLKDIVKIQAELMANAPIHLREFDLSKSFAGRIISVDDRPKVRTQNESTLTAANYDPLPAAIGNTDTSPWTVDRAHQGSFAYLPYILTGEHFYLQEMYYWAAWNISQAHWDSSWGRDNSKGLIRDQIRGVAWAIRNIADAAALAPDNDPEKSYFEDKIVNNINYRASTISQYPLRHMSNSDGSVDASILDSSVSAVTSPWMEDYSLLAWVHLNQLGYDTSEILSEYSKFVIGRFNNADFNWFNGAPYRFPTVAAGEQVSSWSQANALYKSQLTYLPASNLEYSSSYNYVALAALSQVTNYPNGSSAYSWLKNNISIPDGIGSNTNYSQDPRWALIPLGYSGIDVVAPASPNGLSVQ